MEESRELKDANFNKLLESQVYRFNASNLELCDSSVQLLLGKLSCRIDVTQEILLRVCRVFFQSTVN